MTTPITQRDAAARKVTDLAPKVTESAAKVTEIARFRPGPCQSCQVRSRRVGMTKVRTGDSPTAVIVFPAIDLKEGQVVRLAEGDMERATVYGDDPVAWVKLFAEAGAEHLHVVDLDGAFAGESRNRAAVERIVEEFPGYVQLGGGIRTPEAVEGWFELGVARVVIGTAALKDPQFVRDMAGEWENGIVVAVDAKGGMVATEGWAEVSDVPVVDLARRFEDAGVASLLFTDIGRDGLLTGCNIEATVDLARRTSLPVIASGGVKGLDDIRMLAIHADEGIEGVITGRAIYDGRLDIAAAIEMAERT